MNATSPAAGSGDEVTAKLREIRAVLPAEAFRPDPWKLLPMAAATALLLGACGAVRWCGWSGWLVVASAAAAVALSCLAFAAHDLAHGSILRGGCTQELAELFFWSLLLVSPTMWRRLHNQTHHVHYSTPQDPDRPFLQGEECVSTCWYVWVFYPNAEFVPWNPFVFVHFVSYIVRNTVAALLPPHRRPAVVTNRPDYLAGDTRRIALELGFIVALQTGLWWLAGCGGPALVMLVGAQLGTSAVTMTYIFTNHFLNPISHEVDPIGGSTSVIVPAWLDRIHSNFSYHTEHHIFPTLNSDYYPLVSQHLSAKFPDAYRRIPILGAWRQLWSVPAFLPRLR